MIKNKFNVSGICLLIAALIFSCAGLAQGIVVVQPPWDPTLPNQTHQAWEFTGANYDPTNPLPQVDDNPYGDPTIDFTNSTFWTDTIPGPLPDTPPITTWHVDVDGGGFTVCIPNDREPRDWKHIFYQITSDKAPSPSGPTTTPPGTWQPGTSFQHPVSPWYTYTGHISIPGNPEWEYITFTFPASTNIEEIVIDTICIPEPITIGLLGLGGLALLRRRQRI